MRGFVKGNIKGKWDEKEEGKLREMTKFVYCVDESHTKILHLYFLYDQGTDAMLNKTHISVMK